MTGAVLAAEAVPGGPAVPAGLDALEQAERDLRARLQAPIAFHIRTLDTGGIDPAPVRGSVPVTAYGHLVLVGPLSPLSPVSPISSISPADPVGSGPCEVCLRTCWRRLRSHPFQEAFQADPAVPAGGPAVHLSGFGLDLLARAVETVAARGAAPETADAAAIRVVNLRTLTLRTVQLLREPTCPGCSALPWDSDVDPEIDLVAVPKPASSGARPVSAAEYGLPVEALANGVCGLLGSGVLCELQSPTTASTSGSFTLRHGVELSETYWGGHGLTYRDSLHVGLIEGLERFVGTRPRGRRTRIRGSLDALRAQGHRVVDPRETGLYDNAFHTKYPQVLRFAPDQDLDWVRGYSLRDRAPVLVPQALAYFSVPDIRDRFVQECSNGCASGSTLTEAVHHGLLELIERDAFLLAWNGRPELTELDPGTSRSTATRAMVDRLAMYGYRARFFDASMTLPVPVVIAAAERRDGGLGTMCFGSGAALDPESALRSALAEIATDAPHLAWRARRSLAELSAMAEDFERVAALHDHPHLYALPQMARHADFLLRRPASRAGTPVPIGEHYADSERFLPPAADLRTDLLACVGAVAAAGFDVVVVDQTIDLQRRFGLHTVQVLVPGLLPVDFGWVRQRARHMPRMRTALRECGRLPGDLEPADLNPAPHPFP